MHINGDLQNCIKHKRPHKFYVWYKTFQGWPVIAAEFSSILYLT
jgi:hypothetical protein